MKSIHNLVESNLIINKSEFINFLIPVSSTDEVETALKTLKTKHPSANHHCYAYIIGHHQEIQKFSDDGEPSRTAGMPMIDVLKKNDLTNILNVSVRYFGGIKLGVGGLVRAYTKSCSEGIKLASFAILSTFDKLQVSVPFDEIGHVEKYIRDNYKLLDTTYDQSVHYVLEVLNMDTLLLKEKLTEFTKGKAEIKLLDTYTKFK